MSELWMAVNVVWETIVEHAGWVLAYVLAVVLALFLARRGHWRRGWRPAWVLAGLAALAAMVLLPGLTGAVWSDLAYFVDWFLLLVLSAALGAAVLVLAWPLATWLRRPRAPTASGISAARLRQLR